MLWPEPDMCYYDNRLGLPFVAFADTACAKSVVGEPAERELIEFCKANNWPFSRLLPMKSRSGLDLESEFTQSVQFWWWYAGADRLS